MSGFQNLQAGCNSEKLIEVFVRTANDFTGSDSKLELYCWWLLRMEKEDLLTIETGTIEEFLNEMHESGYPAVHHSSVYKNAYSPSYRVIESAFIRELDIVR